MIYLKLFFSFFQIGFVSFGGGYAAMAPIYRQVVELNHWLTAREFADLITISQMTPGPISLNSATFIGLQVAGIPGAVAATIGNVTPSILIVLILAYVYFRFNKLKIIQGVLESLRPAVIALIAAAGISLFSSAMFTPNLDYINLLVFLGVLLLLSKTKLDPTVVMLFSGVLGVIFHIIGII